jgi:hypothetical protein
MMNDWKVVQSKSDKHPEFGYPMGQVLCRNINEAEDLVNNSEEKFYFFLTCYYDEDKELKKISKCDEILEKSTLENIFQKRYEKWTKLFWLGALH